MTTKLRLWNGAITELGDYPLSDTGDGGKAAEALTLVYDQVVQECLSAGSWNFAMETVKLAADTGVTPEFGYSEVFAKPTDWLRTFAISQDEYLNFPLTEYYDDSNILSADTTPIYLRYVSNDTGLGYDLAKWTPAFARYVELELANRISIATTQSESAKERIEKRRDNAKRAALNQDAMNEPNPKFKPAGSWVRSRGGAGGWKDRGSRSSFTG